MEAGGGNSGEDMGSGNPLLRAVFLRRLRLTRLLLDGGSYINESDREGQTPLMVACRTRHSDPQSASRVKIVQFLLEKGADPNIQDKDGCSALMHACRERTGPEVASLLLSSGADISLEDRSGSSALVYAVVAADWAVLKLLLDTCKANGKEVIIITTDKLQRGALESGQCVGAAPLSPLDETDRLSAAPASPSGVQLITSPQRTSTSLCPPKSVFSFKEARPCGVSSHPCSPSRFGRLSQAAPCGQGGALLRLNSEPWLKMLDCVSTQNPQASSSPENGRDLDQAEDLFPQIPKVDGDTQSRDEGSKCDEGRVARDKVLKGNRKNENAKHAGHQMSLPGLLSSHSASHPNLHSVNLGKDPFTSSSYSSSSSSSVTSSSLQRIIQRRNLGAVIYGSDPQLAVDNQNVPEDPQLRARELTPGRRLPPLRCCSTLGSREPSSGQNRRVLSEFERRGSGAFLLDHVRPRSLPPLTLNSTSIPFSDVSDLSSGADCGFGEKEPDLPSAPPGRPKDPIRRILLLRRHSIQSERFKNTA